MSIPTFAEQRHAWSHPPVDDVGYIDSKDLILLTNNDLRALIRQVEKVRYTGWRNYNNRWRSILKMDTTIHSRVLDYGCGIGVEGLQYAKLGNTVSLADISESNLALAKRVLEIFAYEVEELYPISGRSPFTSIPDGVFDVIHCSGVLHHIPRPEPIVKRMASWLDEGGELRLMLYSDRAWRLATETFPPAVTAEHPEFMTFVRAMDGVGGYADWYDYERIKNRFGEWFEIVDFDYITENGTYLAAVLRKL